MPKELRPITLVQYMAQAADCYEFMAVVHRQALKDGYVQVGPDEYVKDEEPKDA